MTNAVRFPDVLDVAKLRQLRTRLGLSMDDAAKAAGMASRQRWYEIESGRKVDVRVSTLEAIAKALKCKPQDLLK